MLVDNFVFMGLPATPFQTTHIVVRGDAGPHVIGTVEQMQVEMRRQRFT